MGRKEAEVYRRFMLDPKEYINRMIIAPYNKATGTDYSLTEQQLGGIEAVRRIVTCKLKRYNKQPMSEYEVEVANKLGVSIMSGKGNGKDGLAAMLQIWFMDCFPYCKNACTSVSADQLKVVLWSEISKWLNHSLVAHKFTLQTDKMYRNDLPKNVVGKRWIAFCKTANPKATAEEQTETLAGLHEDFMMITVDEGAGIPDGVFDPLEGTLTGPLNFIFMIFNPTRTKGYAVDSQYKNSEYWITLRWDSRKSPLVDRHNIERIRKKYGVDSNPWRIRVMGLPPVTDDNTTFPWDWIEAAVNREMDIPEDAQIIKGLDCGAGGDYSVIATRKGGYVYPFKRNKSPDSRVLVEWAAMDIQNEKPDSFRVDTVGLGHGIPAHIVEKIGANEGAVVSNADTRRVADESDRHQNKRAEMYWNLREAFQKGMISIPNDQDLIDALGATKHFFNSRGKTQIIDKKKIKDELGHSPDEADALAITYFTKDDLVSRFKGDKEVYCNSVSRRSEKQAWMRA